MKKLYPIIASVLFIVFLTANGRALPKYGVSELAAPNKEYTLKLVHTPTPYEYRLKILRNGIELAHYPFKGELVSAYWSPLNKYVAVNNHYGHGGFYLWIISLSNGEVISAHGSVRNSSYDRYLDVEDYSPNVFEASKSQIQKVYSGVYKDTLREGYYSSIAYAWLDNNRLSVFYQFPFDKLYTKEGDIIQAYATLAVREGKKLAIDNMSFKRVKDDRDEPIPDEIKSTLDYIK